MKFKVLGLIILTLVLSLQLSAQRVQNPAFEKKIDNLLDKNTPVRTVHEIGDEWQSYIYLDAREEEEYQVSHIPGAIHVGYKYFDNAVLNRLDHNAQIIVYCSIGYRSDEITKRIMAQGYHNVYNLFGSIFEWANCDLPLEDNNGESTQKLHTYNRNWSQWVTNPSIVKTW